MGASTVYHEKQIKELCALHALNNLFQNRESYNKFQLDEICRNLAPNDYINPHRNPSCIDTSKIIGFILNVPSNYKIGIVRLPLQRRHWIALKKIEGEYWNLDSKLDAPLVIGDEAQAMDYLRTQLQSNDKQLFVVCTKEVEKNKGWLLPEYRPDFFYDC
ncbi:josephin-like protein isoform X3 [Sabethes cyaneus]|uniref:josephin-like protein isoform X3 n=1 Tax=Sabethes cyaneus TaxID=53552 RepID=UPI00237D71C4|nr:josephin-like protein isoform X3 [Sabethes cyaneus]